MEYASRSTTLMGTIRPKRIKMKRKNASVNPPSIATNAVGTATATITGLAVGDAVTAIPPVALELGLVCISAIVTAANTVTLFILNTTGGTIDGASRTWTFVVIN